MTPYYNKPTQEGLYQHYKAIAAAIRMPDRRLQRAGPHRRQRRAGHAGAPGADRQHRRREGSFRQHLARWPNVIHEVPENFTVLSGDDAITLPLIALGGRGIISVVSNEIPGAMTQLAQLAMQGDFAAARAIQRQLPAADAESTSSSPIPSR